MTPQSIVHDLTQGVKKEGAADFFLGKFKQLVLIESNPKTCSRS